MKIDLQCLNPASDRFRCVLYIFTLLVLPHALRNLFFHGSLSAGIGASLFLAAVPAFMSSRYRLPRLGYHSVAFVLLIAIGLLLAADQDYPLIFPAVSGGMILLCSYMATIVGARMSRFKPHDILSALKTNLSIIFFFGFVALLTPKSFSIIDGNYPVFPFSEPSHLALASGCIGLFLAAFRPAYLGPLQVSSFLLLGIAFPNVTMIIAGVAIIGIWMSSNIKTPPAFFLRISTVFLGVILVGVVGIQENVLSYFGDRIPALNGTDNLSVLAYQQGWEFILSVHERPAWVGHGFQALHYDIVATESGEKLELLGHGGLTVNSGSFLLAKILAEYGIFSLVLAVIFSICYCSCRNSRRLLISIWISLFVELLFRGYGYFSPQIMMAIALWVSQIDSSGGSKSSLELRLTKGMVNDVK